MTMADNKGKGKGKGKQTATTAEVVVKPPPRADTPELVGKLFADEAAAREAAIAASLDTNKYRLYRVTDPNGSEQYVHRNSVPGPVAAIADAARAAGWKAELVDRKAGAGFETTVRGFLAKMTPEERERFLAGE